MASSIDPNVPRDGEHAKKQEFRDNWQHAKDEIEALQNDQSAHEADTSNPHSVTAMQVGALVSVDGVSNAGGDVDLVASDAVTITPDNPGNQVTIGESHSARTDNPHGVTAAQSGAVDKTGDTMSGNLDMDGNKVTSLGAPAASGEALRHDERADQGGQVVTTNASSAQNNFDNMPQVDGNPMAVRPVVADDAPTESNTLTLHEVDRQTMTAGSYATIFDLSGAIELLKGEIKAVNVGFRLTIDGTEVLDITNTAVGENDAGDTFDIITVPQATSATSMKLEAFNGSNVSRDVSWRAITR